ncbi:hypothetical protein H072_7838 [Dactylellina haptotyla CBS 200.50]|uniref:DUF6314 domain-containing protein n=1 Tax=Dactylellina haptotyla (strain CBS 200.50) TaxID=1284197 RepID=S8A6H6_DACHA|nr:hypothetical protein H072_7838 [Dactylellina haptotyla CBS 200.50]
MSAPQTIFKALQGTWTLRRSLSSAIPTFPSGTFTGTATLAPLASSPQTSLLYSESGELKTESGLVLRANKKYIYRYDDSEDKISAWFVKESHANKASGSNNTNTSSEPSVEPDYLFHDLVFSPDALSALSDATVADCRMTASGDHLCIKDNYAARYAFEFQAGQLKSWSLRYNVKGPSKDYISETRFER